MGVEVKGAGDGVVIADRGYNIMTVATGIPVGALDGEPLVVHW